METEGSAVTGRRATRRKTPSLRWLAEKCKRMEWKNEKWSWTWRISQKNTSNLHLPSKQLPSPEKPFAVAGKWETRKTHTPTDRTCASRVCGEKREMKQNEEALWRRSGRMVSGWGEKMKKKQWWMEGVAPQERRRREWSRFCFKKKGKATFG